MYRVSITKSNLVLLFMEIIAVYSDNHTEAINTCGKNADQWLRKVECERDVFSNGPVQAGIICALWAHERQ
jgi:hypothetical protein